MTSSRATFFLAYLYYSMILCLNSARTSCDVDEVIARRFVDLDVSVPDVVFVPLERHVPVTSVLKEYQSLTVATALG